MAEAIGTLVPSQIASLSDAADIQEAFRLYHYGAPSGTNIGEYDPTNANASSLVANSIAYYISDLNSRVTNLANSPGVQATQWNAKGALVTATANSVVSTLPVGVNGTVLVASSTSSNGLVWQVPSVTPENTATFTAKTFNLFSNTLLGTTAQFNTALTDDNFATHSGLETLLNKTLTSPVINDPTVSGLYVLDSTVTFEGAVADGFETVLTVLEPTADRTITLPNVSGNLVTTGNLSEITSTGTLGSLNVTGNVIYHVDIDNITSSLSVAPTWDGTFITADSSSLIQISLPHTSFVSLLKGTQFTILKTGTGDVTFIAGSANVTVFANPGLKLRGVGSSATVIKLTDPIDSVQKYAVIGDLTT